MMNDHRCSAVNSTDQQTTETGREGDREGLVPHKGILTPVSLKLGTSLLLSLGHHQTLQAANPAGGVVFGEQMMLDGLLQEGLRCLKLLGKRVGGGALAGEAEMESLYRGFDF